MPFIDSKVTLTLNEQQKQTLKSELGQAVRLLHKSEPYLMVGFTDGYELWLGGEKLERAACVTVSLYGRADPADCEAMTARLCQIYQQVLAIPPKNVYVIYHPVENWGWNGSNF